MKNKSIIKALLTLLGLKVMEGPSVILKDAWNIWKWFWKSRLYLILFVTIILLWVIGVSWQNMKDEWNNKPVITPTPVVTTVDTSTPLPTMVLKPKVSVTDWATLEKKYLTDADTSRGYKIWNELNQTRFYRYENGTWVRKNHQADAEVRYYTPTPKSPYNLDVFSSFTEEGIWCAITVSVGKVTVEPDVTLSNWTSLGVTIPPCNLYGDSRFKQYHTDSYRPMHYLP